MGNGIKQLVGADAPDITSRILTLRDVKVVLDSDLALIYGVPTFRFNEAIKRNAGRFPEDFRFQLTEKEWEAVQALRSQIARSNKNPNLISQIARSSSGHGGRRSLPYAFTEHGALQAANVLKSERATAMSIYVIRAFVKMREQQSAHQAILKHLAKIDRTLLTHDVALRDIYQKLRPLLLPPPAPKRREIGFHVKPDDPEKAGTGAK